MGWFSKLFGGGDKPEMPKAKTPQELFQDYLSWAGGAFPGTTAAREKAAGYLGGLQGYQTPIDYAAYGPTSFEQALGTQYFENVWPETERAIKGGLSLSGMASSPILAASLGKARGQVGYDVGKYLTELGQRRAEQAEASRQFNLASALGIEPMPYIGQWGSQEQNRYASQLAEYQKQLEEAQGGGGSALLSLLGTGLGALLAAPTGGMSLGLGAALGGAAGGTIGSLFGGGESPVSFSDALMLSQLGFGGGGGAGAGAGGFEGALFPENEPLFRQGGRLSDVLGTARRLY